MGGVCEMSGKDVMWCVCVCVCVHTHTHTNTHLGFWWVNHVENGPLGRPERGRKDSVS
jgi:hypothetical protein